jgi:hypothetical protein
MRETIIFYDDHAADVRACSNGEREERSYVRQSSFNPTKLFALMPSRANHLAS